VERIVLDNIDALAAGASGLIAEALHEAQRGGRHATMALSGGGTPVEIYRGLAWESRVDWSRVHVCQVDERCVPPDDLESNWRMIRETLLTPADVPLANQHRMAGEKNPPDAAADYEAELRALFAGRPPAFDAVVLGIGEDGHVASLFPGDAALDERERWVLHTHAPASSPVRDRLTLTLPVLNAARLAVYIVSGAGKRDVAARAMAGDAALPAARVRPAGRLVWMLNSAAAGLRGPRDGPSEPR
jgi:6-phosphogluconolactonase